MAITLTLLTVKTWENYVKRSCVTIFKSLTDDKVT